MEEKDEKDEKGSPKNEMNRSGNTNVDDQTKVDKSINVNSFSYLDKRNDEDTISFFVTKREENKNSTPENDTSNNAFLSDAGKYKYAICVLLKDDLNDSSFLLDKTLKGIINNLGDLTELTIKYKEIIIFVFVSQLRGNKLVNKDSIKEHLNNEKENYYLKTPLKFKDDKRVIKIDIISKKYYMSYTESLRCFYYYIVKNLKRENNRIITSVITTGVVPNKDGLAKLIKISFSDKKKKDKDKNKKSNPKSDEKYAIAVPALEIKEKVKENNLYKKIAQYERFHFNVYPMNFYNQAGSVPISSLLNTKIIDDTLLKDISSFYSTIDYNSTIDYHDYCLGLFLIRNSYKTIYYSKEILGQINYGIFDFNDYQDNWINKYSGYYGNFFQILKTFIFCSNIQIFSKVFMFFQIIGLIVEFVYPGLSLLVIYSVFIEAFGEAEFHSAVFMVMLYLIIYLAGGVISITSKSSKENNLSNLYIYILMEIYYLFIIICSIVAMINISKESKLSLEEYKFNKAACAILIILTFIVAIIPIILKINIFAKNIVQMIFYLFLGAPSSTSSFLIAKIWKAPETSGGNSQEEKKGIIILAFFLSNLFFGCLGFFIYNTKLRATCVMGLSIAYLIYLFFKILAIIFTLLFGAQIKEDKGKEKLEIDEIIDITAEKGNNNKYLDNDIYNDNDNELRNSTDHLNRTRNNEQENSGEDEKEEKLDNDANDGNNNNDDNDRDNDFNIINNNNGDNNNNSNNNDYNNDNSNNGDNNNNSNNNDNNNNSNNNDNNDNNNNNNDNNNNDSNNNDITQNGDNNNNSNDNNNNSGDNNNNSITNNGNNNNYLNENNGENNNSSNSNFNIVNNSQDNNNSHNGDNNDNEGNREDDQDRYKSENPEEFKTGE